jgi:hypothetical protein
MWNFRVKTIAVVGSIARAARQEAEAPLQTGGASCTTTPQ